MPRRKNPRQPKCASSNNEQEHDNNTSENSSSRRKTRRRPSLSPTTAESSPRKKIPPTSESDDSICYIKPASTAAVLELKPSGSDQTNLNIDFDESDSSSSLPSSDSNTNSTNSSNNNNEKETEGRKLPRRLPPPVKPAHDPKAYRIIELENGIKVALVSEISSEEGGTFISSENTPGVQLPTINSDYVFFRPRENPNQNGHQNANPNGANANDCSWCRSFFDQPSLSSNITTKDFSVAVTSAVESNVTTGAGAGEPVSGPGQNSCNYHLPGFPIGSCSVAACVGVGYLNDPADCQGLAHLCEHMVFMGSSEFETEDLFMRFIRENGGTFNALTSAEYTKYQFETSALSVDKALNIFSNFFKTPLFHLDAIKREVENVNHEFIMKKQSDSFSRMELLHGTAKKNHPYRTFACGNRETLAKKGEEEDYEKLKGHLEEFHKKFYTPQNITLAIRGRLHLNDLENLAVTYFSNLKKDAGENTNTQPCDKIVSTRLKNPFDTSEFKQRILVEPVGAIDSLYLTWSLPSQTWQNYTCKPLAYLSSVISSEISGGLVDYLKTRKWVLDLRCGPNFDSCTKYGVLYTIRMYITDEGYAHQDEIIQAVYAFLQKLKDLKPSHIIYDDISSIKRSYLDNYGCNYSSAETVEKLAWALHLFPSDKLITGDKLLFHFNAPSITSAINYLMVDNMNIMVFSHGFGVSSEKSFSKIEPNLKIKYDSEKIGTVQIRQWKKPDVALRNKFRNPFQTNRFKTSEFILYHRGVKYPEIRTICKNEHTIAAWLPLAIHFPFAIFRVALSSNQGPLTGNQMSMLHIWASMLKFELREAIGLAREAGVYCAITAQDSFLAVEVYGYDKKALQLAREILGEISKKTVLKDETFFSVCKNFTLKMCHYALLHPFCMANQLLRRLKLFGADSAIDVQNWLLQTSHADFNNFIQVFMSKMKLSLWVGGNALKDDVEAFTKDFEQNFEVNALKRCYNTIYTPRIVSLPHANLIYRVQSINANHSTSMLINYHQFGLATPQAAALVKPLITMMEVPFFNEIRSRKTLGYAVSCSPTCDNGVLGAIFFVCTDAEKFKIETVSREIDNFVETFYHKVISPMKEDEFGRLVQRFPSLRLASLELMKKMYVELLFPKGKFYSKLSVQVVGHKKSPCGGKQEPKSSHGQDYQSPIELKNIPCEGEEKDEKGSTEGGQQVIWITDIDQLHQRSSLFPVLPMMRY